MNGEAAALIPIDFAPVDATLRWQDEVRTAVRRCAAFLERADTRVSSASTRVSSIESSPLSGGILAHPPRGAGGRGWLWPRQLFPHSDVDILILLPGPLDAAGTTFVERWSACLGYRARSGP